jgi:2-polyprenyl-6-methoxyphenol hydroxylase-like FAD-dependent oxidoreductase
MSPAKPVQIVGGGLAGLTLGIALRQRKIPVTIFEAGNYPRHRVCGEFISGRGQDTLARLGLRGRLETSGAIPAVAAAFFTDSHCTQPRPLPASAICLSRYKLDALLADEFQRLGGELICGRRWRDEGFREGVVRASGRRLEMDKGGARWFGLKIHARNIPLAADLEMHFSPRGYVGLCRLSGGETNICGLFRRQTDGVAETSVAREWLRGEPDSILRKRLAAAEFDEKSFCAVAGISLRPQRAAVRGEICIGDAITMTPPVTGNGMSMAFESAELAVDPLAAWGRGEISWDSARQKIARACDQQFSQRLAWAKWLQRMLLTPALQNPLLLFASRNEWFWRMAFERTR